MPFNRIMGAVFNPINIAQVMMGPAGWASLAMRTVGAQLGMNIIQQLGRQMGVPQPFIDLAQANFAGSIGMPGLQMQNMREAAAGFANTINFSPRQTAEFQQSVLRGTENIYEMLSEAAAEGRRRAERDGEGDGRSWLQVIADNMSRVLDAKVKEMDRLARALDDQGSNRSTKTANDLQVQTQEFSYIMQATSTVIKSIGEGLSAMARKQ